MRLVLETAGSTFRIITFFSRQCIFYPIYQGLSWSFALLCTWTNPFHLLHATLGRHYLFLKNYTILTIPPYHYFVIYFPPKTCSSANLYKIKNGRIVA